MQILRLLKVDLHHLQLRFINFGVKPEQMQTQHLGENLFHISTQRVAVTITLLAWKHRGKRLWDRFHNC